jgi:flagellar hook-length control protein FliK
MQAVALLALFPGPAPTGGLDSQADPGALLSGQSAATALIGDGAQGPAEAGGPADASAFAQILAGALAAPPAVQSKSTPASDPSVSASRTGSSLNAAAAPSGALAAWLAQTSADGQSPGPASTDSAPVSADPVGRRDAGKPGARGGHGDALSGPITSSPAPQSMADFTLASVLALQPLVAPPTTQAASASVPTGQGGATTVSAAAATDSSAAATDSSAAATAPSVAVTAGAPAVSASDLGAPAASPAPEAPTGGLAPPPQAAPAASSAVASPLSPDPTQAQGATPAPPTTAQGAASTSPSPSPAPAAPPAAPAAGTASSAPGSMSSFAPELIRLSGVAASPAATPAQSAGALPVLPPAPAPAAGPAAGPGADPQHQASASAVQSQAAPASASVPGPTSAADLASPVPPPASLDLQAQIQVQDLALAPSQAQMSPPTPGQGAPAPTASQPSVASQSSAAQSSATQSRLITAQAPGQSRSFAPASQPGRPIPSQGLDASTLAFAGTAPGPTSGQKASSDDGSPSDDPPPGQVAADAAASPDPSLAAFPQPFAAPVASGAATAAAQAALGPQTVSQLAADLVKKVQAKASRFELALEPAGLGRVDVSVRIGADGSVSAALNFSDPQSAEALKAHAGELRDALQQAGFSLGGSDLSFTAGGSGDQSGGGGSSGRSSTHSPFTQIADIADAQAQAAPLRASAASASGVDIRI